MLWRWVWVVGQVALVFHHYYFPVKWIKRIRKYCKDLWLFDGYQFWARFCLGVGRFQLLCYKLTRNASKLTVNLLHTAEIAWVKNPFDLFWLRFVRIARHSIQLVPVGFSWRRSISRAWSFSNTRFAGVCRNVRLWVVPTGYLGTYLSITSVSRL